MMSIIKFFLILSLTYFLISENSFSDANNDSTINILNEQSLAAESKGDFSGAIELHKKIYALQPANYQSLNNIAGLYGKLTKYEDEIIWANKAIALNPKYSLAYINLGNAYFSQGLLGAAEKAYVKAISLDPNSAITYYNLGLIADAVKDFNSSVTFYEKAVELNPKSEEFQISLAIAYANNRENENVVKTLKKILAMYPNSEYAKILLLHFTPVKIAPKSKEKSEHAKSNGH